MKHLVALAMVLFALPAIAGGLADKGVIDRVVAVLSPPWRKGAGCAGRAA